MTRRFSVVLSVVLLAGLLSAVAVSAQDGLALMKVEPGARPAGMGGAFTSVAGDPSGAFYNPAAAADFAETTIKLKASMGYNTYWENVSLQTGYLSAALSERVWLHGGIRFASISDLESRKGPSSDPDGYFDAHDVSFKSGLACRLTDRLVAGVALGWYLEKIDQYRGTSFNTDFGLTYQASENLSVGASVINLGGDLSLSTDSDNGADIPLPTTYRTGISYTYRGLVLGAADLVYLDDEAHVHVGVEGRLHERFALRAGYMAGYDSKDFTAGATFTHRNFDIDYAFVPYSNDLGTSHLFNLTVSL